MAHRRGFRGRAVRTPAVLPPQEQLEAVHLCFSLPVLEMYVNSAEDEYISARTDVCFRGGQAGFCRHASQGNRGNHARCPTR